MARLLREKGFDAFAIEGGLRAWRQQSLPIESVPPEDVVLLPRFD